MTIYETQPVMLTPQERDILSRALEAYFFAETIKEHAFPLDYGALRRKLRGKSAPYRQAAPRERAT